MEENNFPIPFRNYQLWLTTTSAGKTKGKKLLNSEQAKACPNRHAKIKWEINGKG